MKCSTLTTVLCLITFAALASTVSASTPEVVSYQGYLTDDSENPLSGNYIITFGIYADEFGGIAIWTEAQNVTVSAGKLNVLLGAIYPLTQDVFSDSIRYLGVKVGNYPEMPRIRLTSSPFAYRIATVDGSVSTLLVLTDENSTRVELGIGADIMKVFDSTGALRVRLGLQGGTGEKGLDGGGAISFFRANFKSGAESNLESISLVRIGESIFGTGEVSINDEAGARLAQMTSTSVDGGAYYTFLPDSTRLTIQGQATDSSGYIGTYGTNGNWSIALSSLVGYSGRGYVAVMDAAGVQHVGLYVDHAEDGHITTWNQYGDRMVDITNSSTDPVVNGGHISLLGTNGSKNVVLSHTVGYGNRGKVDVLDGSGDAQAGMMVDGSGAGIIWGDQKSFAVDNPNKAGTELWYTSLEGPEAAAYFRGTAELDNGQAIVRFPDYFSSIINVEGMTVQVVPLSAESKGLAITSKQHDHMVVRELMKGTGSYSFDYVVTAVRAGYESYRVVRSKEEREVMNAKSSTNQHPGPSKVRSDMFKQ